MEHFIEIKTLRNGGACLINVANVLMVGQNMIISPNSAIMESVAQIRLTEGISLPDYSRDYSEWVFMLTGRSAPYGSKHPE